ncbi:mechanosensitive ion channel [bacterium]|nr:mechanosensitive ion channel [bacterium]
MRQRWIVVCLLACWWNGLFAQRDAGSRSSSGAQSANSGLPADTTRMRFDRSFGRRSIYEQVLPIGEKLALSDFILRIERIDDQINSIADSTRLRFEVVGLSRRIDKITQDINLIRQNTRGRTPSLNMKNLFLYQNLAFELDQENARLQMRTTALYDRVYRAKVNLKAVLSDTVFKRPYTNKGPQNELDFKLLRLKRKWTRTDSLTRVSIDSLNSIKIRIADNSMNLSSMLNMMEFRLDRAGQQLVGPETSVIWRKAVSRLSPVESGRKPVPILTGEQKAIGYYLRHTKGERVAILVLAGLLLLWLYGKRNLLKRIAGQRDQFAFLHMRYLTTHPILALLLVVLCVMLFFDVYAPSSFSAVEHLLILAPASVLFCKLEERRFSRCWIGLGLLFLALFITQLALEPSLAVRIGLLILYAATLWLAIRFLRALKQWRPKAEWIKVAVRIGIVLVGLAMVCNIFGRITLSGILGFAGLYAMTQAMVLPVFFAIVIELIVLQMQSSRMKQGIHHSFEIAPVIKKINTPLFLIAALLWVIMLAANLNLYHVLYHQLVQFLTITRTIGSISYKLISVLWLFAVIWLAHILQWLVSFFFGDPGNDADDLSPLAKKQQSRLLILRLLVLTGGYLLAVAASGLPLDKLTILLGALGIGVGMGLQNVVNNFVSGIILIFEGAFQIGDQIEISGQEGKVKEIGLRASTLSTADGADVIIPNGSILSQNIVNWTYSNDDKRVLIHFALSGKALDADLINEVIHTTLAAIPQVAAKRKPVILYKRVTQDSCWLTVRFWSTVHQADAVKSEAMLRLSAAFTAHKIEFK